MLAPSDANRDQHCWSVRSIVSYAKVKKVVRARIVFNGFSHLNPHLRRNMAKAEAHTPLKLPVAHPRTLERTLQQQCWSWSRLVSEGARPRWYYRQNCSPRKFGGVSLVNFGPELENPNQKFVDRTIEKRPDTFMNPSAVRAPAFLYFSSRSPECCGLWASSCQAACRGARW